MIKQISISLALLLLAGCGHAQPATVNAANLSSSALAVRDAHSALSTFLAGDHTFTGTGTENAYKVASEGDGSGGFFVQMWYRDLTGFFGNAASIQADFGDGHSHDHFQTFTLTNLRNGFYQMDSAQKATNVGQPVVAFHLDSKWDSNMGNNYNIHYQPFPTQPW